MSMDEDTHSDQIEGGQGPGRAFEPKPTAALSAWCRQGARTAFLRRPDWLRVRPTPSVVVALLVAALLVRIVGERLYIGGPATFYWQAFRTGWMGTVVTIWICWLLVPEPRQGVAREPASAAALFTMLAAQEVTILLLSGILLLPMARLSIFSSTVGGRWIAWGGWTVVLVWCVAAELLLILRTSARGVALRSLAAAIVVVTAALQVWLEPARFWYPDVSSSAEAERYKPFRPSQELMELQPRILQAKLQSIEPERPGTVDVYAITFAPYADDDVFQRESDLVATVMQERFGAAGRTIQLVNSRQTVRQWPWATPLNLQRTIQRLAQVMNRDEDILFVHLTSHGARDGKLSAEFWPLAIDEVTPQMLRTWLDEAGIRNRVISVSACYSGSWIEPLTDPGTLVMTAADATHTSYGCGNGSTYTYFGRAVFDEQLRQTWSFEKAHAAARSVIEKREQEAGKRDGFSNPQIKVGDRIRERLSQMEHERAQRL